MASRHGDAQSEMQAGHPGRPRAPEVGERLGEHGLPSQPQTAAPRQVPPPVVSQAPKPSIHCWGAVVSLAGAESLSVTRSLTKERHLKDRQDSARREGAACRPGGA